jgi:tetratricopeptide (TPR) repeat protein/predicted Ser/Thr protein kinase/TolB-like protein
MEDKKPKSGRGQDAGLGGLRAPAKGDSAPSGVPLENDGMTFIEPPKKPATKPPAKPPTKPPAKLPADPTGTVVNANLTLDGSDSVQGSSGGRSYSGMYREVVLQPGDILGGRYEILELLGEGGMGAVYKAQDREVDRFIALKLIRPELASNPAILARFKQELLTAHQVTHKNVIRIYDIAEADGVKFITMEFVEGHDLRRFLLDDGRLPPEKAVEIVRQICLALDAAHSAGIIHRDLKPQNVMLDKQGRILVMDFGLARQVESEGMTQTGALLGTIEYMSPEQAMGKPLDQRSDLFALGLIFYELLTGKMPYKAETAMASLLKRNQDRAIPATEIDATIPKGLSDIVGKCLERDLTLRYQSANEILADLDAWEGKRPINASIVIPPPKQPFPWKWVAPGALAVILAAGGVAFKDKIFKSTPAGSAATVPQLALAILPFHNATTDTSLDWLGTSLADMLNTDVGQSAHMRTVSPDRLHQIFIDLRIPANAALDQDTLRHVVEQSNADTVVYGQYAKFGNQIRIDATLDDIKGNRRRPMKIEVASEQEIPAKIDELAELIRKNLAVSPDVLKELKASSFQPSSKSVPALRDYNQAVQLLRDGKNLEAVKLFQAAIKDDPQFALAYSHLAETDLALGYDTDAENYSRKALELSQQLPRAEKYLIEANHARTMKDNKKAIEAYENLAKTFPDNSDVEYALGSLYVDNGDYDKARTQFSKILQSDPKNIKALWQMGGVEIMKDNPQAALDPLNKGLSLAIQVDNQEQKALLLQAMGISYRQMNKPEEALRNYQESLAIQRRIGQKRGEAASLNEMAHVYLLLGKPDAALQSYNAAMQVRREIGAKKEIGDTLMDLGNFYVDRGQYDQALKMLKESLQIQRDSGDEAYQAECLNNIGSVYLTRGQYDDALTYFQQALQLREKLKVPGEIVETVYNLANTAAKMGQYDQALSQYLRALDLYRSAGDKRGAAIDLYGMGSLFGYQGRYGAALNSKEEALKTFRELQDRSSWMAEILSGYGGALVEAGRGDEAQKTLEEALSLARELKSQPVIAQTLNFQGDGAFFRGDLKSARTLYGQALEAVSHTTDRDNVLTSKISLAKVAIQEGHSAAAIGSLKSLAQEADSLGLKYLSAQCSTYRGEALLGSKDYAHAQQELQTALGKAEKLGLRELLAKDQYLLATALRLTGNGTEASGHYREALRWLEEIRKEAGSDKVMQRTDLNSVYAESARWSQAGKS